MCISIGIFEILLSFSREGRSRSPAVIIAYLIKENNLSYDKAFSLVKEKRSFIDLKLSKIR